MNSNSIRAAEIGRISTDLFRVSDLVAQLAALYPAHFRGDQGEAWGLECARLLRSYGSDELRLAWADVMDGWEKQSPPRPAAFARAAKAHMIEKPKGPKRDPEFIRNRAFELKDAIKAKYDMTGWPDAKRWRAMKRWDDLAWMQAQYEDSGHEDPIGATARRFDLDERFMWEPPA